MKKRAMFVFCLAIAAAALFGEGIPEGELLPGEKVAYAESECLSCHNSVTPNIVLDWQMSSHSTKGVACETCHGDQHTSSTDQINAVTVTPETCAKCHSTQVDQFTEGKHALAWAAMYAMPSIHQQPVAMIEGQKGCGGCHKIGLKSEAEIKQIKTEQGGYGLASCDACHTRHTFSKKEAQQPQSCQTCHMGFDHPQWEMYSASKHGVRFLLAQNGTLPEHTVAPTCQTCHMQEGNHEVMTAWGFLAVRLPLPEDPEWAADQVTILQGLGVLDPNGEPTARLDVVAGAKVARLTQEDFDEQRNKMIDTCTQCHSSNFAVSQLEKGDDMIREADKLLAEAIRIIADLYSTGKLEVPESYAYAFPDLLTFHDAPSPIEHTLFEMHLKHRMRAFQGTFHANPDYALWYGWSEMVRDLADIKEMAARLKEG